MKLIFAAIGLLGEIITGIHRVHTLVTDNTNKTLVVTPMINHEHEHIHEHVHRREVDSPRMESSWAFEHANIQHSTMYTTFIIGAIVEILRNLSNKLKDQKV